MALDLWNHERERERAQRKSVRSLRFRGMDEMAEKVDSQNGHYFWGI